MGVKILDLKSLNYDEELRSELETALNNYRLIDVSIIDFVKNKWYLILACLLGLIIPYCFKIYIFTFIVGLISIFYLQRELYESNKNNMFDGMKNTMLIINKIVNNKIISRGYYILLDTTVMFDSRIIDLLTEPILKDRLYIPRFVIEEIVSLSKGKNLVKSEMAKETMNNINVLIKNNNINIVDEERDGGLDVDMQLISLAERIGGIVFTNDKDLSLKATKRGIMVSSLIDLAESLEEPFGIGELFDVKIVKRGKEKGEGLAYMRDGTTVVVYGADNKVNKNLMIKVENIIKSPNGRVLFAKVVDEEE